MAGREMQNRQNYTAVLTASATPDHMTWHEVSGSSALLPHAVHSTPPSLASENPSWLLFISILLSVKMLQHCAWSQ